MPTSAKIRLRNEQHAKNITKRGLVNTASKNKEEGYTVGPVLLGFFLFVVVGSAALQIIRTAQMGGAF